MTLKWSDTKKFLIRFGIVYCLFGVLFFAGIRWYMQRNFSEDKVDQMMRGVSSLRDKTDDPCKYSIFGDPGTAKSEFVKVFLYCNYPNRVTNTFDLRAIENRTVINVIKEIGRVNGFDVEIIEGQLSLGGSDPKVENWQCYEDRKRVIDYSLQVNEKSTIECFKNKEEVQIKEHYEN